MNNINNLILELNSQCNNNCIYCYIPEKNRFSDKVNVNTNYFKNVLNEYAKLGVKSVDFTGGEPTLYSHLSELIKYSKKIGFENRTLVTNGKLLSYEKYCMKLSKAGINGIVLPFDGPNKRITEAITRTPGSFEQIIMAIKNIKALKINLGVTFVINKLNYKYVQEMISKSLELGADYINIQFLLPFVKDSNVVCKRIPSNIIPTYRDAIKYVKKGIDSNKDRKIKLHFIPFCLMEGYENYIYKESNKFDRQVVNYKGYSYNIGEHLKKGAVKIDSCKDCKFTNKCIGFFKNYAKEFGINNIIEKGINYDKE